MARPSFKKPGIAHGGPCGARLQNEPDRRADGDQRILQLDGGVKQIVRRRDRLDRTLHQIFPQRSPMMIVDLRLIGDHRIEDDAAGLRHHLLYDLITQGLRIRRRDPSRVGRAALERIAVDGTFVRGLHSIGELDPERRFIMHFPEELSIESFGSGYGGNALLGKKCHALRIASYQARTEGWLAEHMLIVGLQNPKGETHYVACAFPSACGKTNLAMLIPPDSMPGWKVFTVGDDIAWLHPGADGRLWAINPEAGYFGVVPGTNPETNRNAYEMIRRDTLFTNVALTADNQPWWEGLSTGKPVIDWQGRPYDPARGPAAHPNSRFTVSAKRNPAYSPRSEDPKGVPISAIVFGGRRREVAPLVYEARDWKHGVLVGASVASETTAAMVGQQGVVRRDPMAMLPFCGYNFADYWQHWLNIGAKLARPPRIYHVNWFRRDAQNKFLWPGYGENLRVLEWMLDRCAGNAGATETPIGRLPLVKLFSSVLQRDDEGTYWLATPVERGRITVEDAPFTAVELTVTGEGQEQILVFRTNMDDNVSADENHPLRIDNDNVTRAPNPYILVRDGLEARLTRAVFYQLVDIGREERVGETVDHLRAVVALDKGSDRFVRSEIFGMEPFLRHPQLGLPRKKRRQDSRQNFCGHHEH